MAATPGRAPSLRSVETLGAVAIFAFGVVLHSAYPASGGSKVVAALAPANESVWEHLKLVVLPVALLGLVETRWVADRDRLWWAKLVEAVFACAFIVAFFYTYTGAFGVGSILAVDITSFLVAIALGQWISYRLITSGGRVPAQWVSVAGLLLCLVGFGVLTFAPPHIPLFRETSTGTYGPTSS